MSEDFVRDISALVITFTCVGVFVATAIASVLDLFNLLKLAPDIRKKLHAVLVVEIVGISIAAFSGLINPTRAVKKYEDVKEQNIQSKATLLLAQAEFSEGKKKSVQPDLRSIQKSVQNASNAQLRESKVLWVDDNPTNQSYERQALQQLGVQFLLASTTEKAIAILREQRVQVVITDFKRADDPQGGFTLLQKIQEIGLSTPVIIYSGSANPEFVADAKRRGAYGETNRPQELFDMVVDAIKK